MKHAQFGPGTVVSVEDLEDDQKLVVKFASVGRRRCAPSYAKLRAGLEVLGLAGLIVR